MTRGPYTKIYETAEIQNTKKYATAENTKTPSTENYEKKHAEKYAAASRRRIFPHLFVVFCIWRFCNFRRRVFFRILDFFSIFSRIFGTFRNFRRRVFLRIFFVFFRRLRFRMFLYSALLSLRGPVWGVVALNFGFGPVRHHVPPSSVLLLQLPGPGDFQMRRRLRPRACVAGAAGTHHRPPPPPARMRQNR